MENGYVYLLAEMGNDLRYKIGFTKNCVKKRLKQLSTGNSNEVRIIYTYKSPNYKKIEHMMHLHFHKERMHLEWFEMSDEIVSTFLKEAKKMDKLITFLLKNNEFYN